MLGINGFVLGPLIAALFIVVWSLFRQEQEQEQQETGVSQPSLAPESTISTTREAKR